MTYLCTHAFLSGSFNLFQHSILIISETIIVCINVSVHLVSRSPYLPRGFLFKKFPYTR